MELFLWIFFLFINMAATSTDNGDSNKNGLLLYFHDYSFYSQKVLMALHEKKLTFKTQVVDISKYEQYEPWFIEINPRGEVPVLKDGVRIIPDSVRIIDYLEDNFSNGNSPRLMPSDPTSKQKVVQLREMINEIPANLVTVGAFYHPENIVSPKMPFISPVRSALKESDMEMSGILRKAAERNPGSREILLQKAEAQDKKHAKVITKEGFQELMDQVDSTLDKVEEQLASNNDSKKWLVSEQFTVADIGLTILLTRLNQIGMENRFWENGKRPHVTEFFARATLRDSYKKTMPTVWTHITNFIGAKTIIGGVTLITAIVGGCLFYHRKKL